MFTGLTVNDLLLRIEQMLDAKIGVPSTKTENQSGYITRKEVASLLKITLPTLHDWTKLGYLKSYKMGTRVLYKECEVKQALENVQSFKHKKGDVYMANLTIKKKGKMYECQAFFDSSFPKKWKYVRDLNSFAQFLNKSHSSWKYFNVYEKGTKQYLKRFYPGNAVPKTLLLLVLFGLGLLNPKIHL